MYRIETLPKEATNLIIRFISHPVADIIKPEIHKEWGSNVIRFAYRKCEHDLSRHSKDELSRQYWDRTVIENTIRNKLQIRCLTADDLHELDPLFVHMNKEATG